MWIGEGVLFVALPDRQMNSLGEGRVVGNLVVNNFVTSNFIKMKSSENHLPPKTPPKQNSKLLHALTPCQLFPLFRIVGKFWPYHKIFALLIEISLTGYDSALGKHLVYGDGKILPVIVSYSLTLNLNV